MRKMVQGHADPPFGQREVELLEFSAERLAHAGSCTCKQVRDGSLQVVIGRFVCTFTRFQSGVFLACVALERDNGA